MSSKKYFDDVASQWDKMRETFFSEAVREKAFADEYVLILQKIEDIDVSSEDDVFVTKLVTQEMLRFKKQLTHFQGTSIRGKRPTKERLLKNIDKINEAIEIIPQDIKCQ